MSQGVDHVAAHYDRVTKAWTYLLGEDLHYGYFRSRHETLEDATHTLTDFLADAARITENCLLLDVGCGTGKPACDTAARSGCAVTGISTSRIGVELARGRAAARDLSDRVTFHIRDGMKNRFPTGSFERCWVLESSHLIAQKEALIGECSRVMKAGGIFALCDIIVHATLPLSEVLRKAKTFDLLHRVFGRAKMETIDFYVEECRRNGLYVEAIQDISDQTRPTFDCWRRNAHIWREEIEMLIGEDYLAAFVQSCDILEGLWDDRTLGYSLVLAKKVAQDGFSDAQV